MNVNFISIFVKKVEPTSVGLFFLLSYVLKWTLKGLWWFLIGLLALVGIWIGICLFVLLIISTGNVGGDATSTVTYSDNSKNLIEALEIEPQSWTKESPVKDWDLPPEWVPKEK